MKKEILTNLDLIQKGDIVLLLGTALFFNVSLQEKLRQSEAKIVYLHPIDYKSNKLHFSQYIKYEVGSEEGICALLLSYFVDESTPTIKAFIDDLDIGYLSAETSLGEEELEEVVEQTKEANNIFLFLSENFLGHKKAKNIIKMLGVLNKYTPLNLIIQNVCDKNIHLINEYKNGLLEKVEELDSYDGLIICKNACIEKNQLRGGVSFSKMAKINDGDEVLIKFDNQNIQRKFKVDTNLQGTVALCSEEGIKSVEYGYKIVKIEKVD